jgi:thioredoxin reductase
MTATHYDVIVLGGGATGEHAAAAVGLADASPHWVAPSSA